MHNSTRAGSRGYFFLQLLWESERKTNRREINRSFSPVFSVGSAAHFQGYVPRKTRHLPNNTQNKRFRSYVGMPCTTGKCKHTRFVVFRVFRGKWKSKPWKSKQVEGSFILYLFSLNVSLLENEDGDGCASLIFMVHVHTHNHTNMPQLATN